MGGNAAICEGLEIHARIAKRRSKARLQMPKKRALECRDRRVAKSRKADIGTKNDDAALAKGCFYASFRLLRYAPFRFSPALTSVSNAETN